ncbi:MAG: sugar kinase [Christensenellaceae bacterium]|jgi:2-dehydro-3-deoxygluconokinase|nr:sugar kinase [Christensenellaceae bacterium]
MSVLTFGEIMMRLQPTDYQRFTQTNSYKCYYGGGEANVAVSLANFGEDVKFLTKLPLNSLGDACLRALKEHNVNVDHVIRGGERLGLYFSEKGASQRASKIIYDRKNSAINSIDIKEIEMDALFDSVKHFHFTGITPALSNNTLTVLEVLLKEAKDRGVPISCDLNYRNSLWDRQKAEKTMTKLIRYCDILVSNEEECYKVFGLQATSTNIANGTVNLDGYVDIAKEIQMKFSNLKLIAFTLRKSISASINRWSSIIFSGGTSFYSKEYEINVEDRIGSGDAYCAGLIYSLLKGMSKSEAVEFATAASCLKHTIEGDFNEVSVHEIFALVAGDGSGRVQR